MKHDRRAAELHRDPLSGEPGAHPLGTGIGAALGGAAAGAATGSLAGPLGTLVGTAAGAIVGGLTGKGVAEAIAPTDETAYWRERAERSDAAAGAGTGHDRAAYGFGASAFSRYPGQRFEAVEAEMASYWNASRGSAGLSWEQARAAAYAGWMELGRSRG